MIVKSKMTEYPFLYHTHTHTHKSHGHLRNPLGRQDFYYITMTHRTQRNSNRKQREGHQCISQLAVRLGPWNPAPQARLPRAVSQTEDSPCDSRDEQKRVLVATALKAGKKETNNKSMKSSWLGK